MAEAGLIPVPTTALILAGGRGQRLGGVEKGELRLEGQRLIDIVVEGALSSGCDRAVIVGEPESKKATSIREQTPFTGPVAGLATGLPEVRTDWLMLLACDLPHAGLLCHLLAESFHHMTSDFDGLAALHQGRVQWLAGIYRMSSIEMSLERIGSPAGASMNQLLGALTLREVQDPDGLSRDIDTPEELRAFQGEVPN